MASSSNRLADRVVVVTGATGIAAAAAARFAEEGATVFTISIHPHECEELHGRISGNHSWAAADLTDETAAKDAFDSCREQFGRIDGLLAVAGGSGRAFGDGPTDAVTLEAWQATLDLNLTTSFLAVREALRHMIDQEPGGGSIVLTSSVLADHPSPRRFATHAYATAKGAQLALVGTTAAHYADRSIRVNAIQPGLVDTPMSARAQADQDTMRYAAHKQPLAGGIIPADDVAAAALFLLSDEARFITGQMLAVEGGWGVTEA